ncbi:MAG: 4'-phosphopantetheinyl transferase superfamily protein [Gemmatimonadota bacterium]|jgi:4'-phosphopantetheinyl transferase
MKTRGAASAPAEVALAWGRSTEVPDADGWLTPAERGVLEGLRLPKRARDWRLGRWVAKEAVRRCLGAPGLPGENVEILAAASGRPEATILAPGPWGAITLSLSHAGGVGFAAASAAPLLLGCDVEVVEGRSDAFVDDYLTAAEATWVRRSPEGRDRRANLVWSAKESALKALGEGLRADTRSVEVTVSEGRPGAWSSLEVCRAEGALLPGWWHAARSRVWTVVASAPVRLGPIPPD